MALTTLDAKTALVVIDLQQGIVALPTAPPPARSSSAPPVWPMHFAVTACPWCSSMWRAARPAARNNRVLPVTSPPALQTSFPN